MVKVDEPVIPILPLTIPENGIVEPVMLIPVVIAVLSVDEPVIPTDPPVNAVTVVIDPVIGTVTEIPDRVEPVTDKPVVMLTGRVAEPVIPTEPLTTAPVTLTLIVVEPVMLTPVFKSTGRFTLDPVIPTEPPVNAETVTEPETL